MDRAEKNEILQSMGIPEEFYDSLFKEFMGSMDNWLSSLKAALRENNFASLSKIAHSVKGVSANLRVYSIQKYAGQIEMMGKQAVDPLEIAKSIEMMEESYLILKKEQKI